ncbi:hypothetical protein [Mangrovibacter phragmitis]|uniref:hypothetical protein n=1 Tax=Mangrovibacter phragmitis TaxID=1691903 RepID=UPI0012E7F528|nr:hypothetical protein [Mangrovibacter phragmitis]
MEFNTGSGESSEAPIFTNIGFIFVTWRHHFYRVKRQSPCHLFSCHKDSVIMLTTHA